MGNCIFCKIVDGSIPSEKIYEDDKVLAFLDIAPINLGHLLVIPKEHFVGSSAIPEDVAGRMFHIASRLGVAMKRAFEADGFNLHLADGSSAGQVVMHAHLHVVPRYFDDGFHWNWRNKEYSDDTERRDIAEKLKSKIKI